tara:strand:- start:99 stop:824 length:726 start_codon:yes stop_codon:yes gene_type:complete
MEIFKNYLKNFESIYKFQKHIRYKSNEYFVKNYKDLIDNHFKFKAEYGEMNKELFELSIGNFKNKAINIFETGSSANWGANSSILFDSYISKFGGKFITVDIRSEANKYLNSIFSKGSLSFQEDSLKFIENFDQEFFNNLNLIYLDSYDLDINNPQPSMEHCLNEFILLDKRIRKGCLVAIDDTPNLKAFEKYMNHHFKDDNSIESYGFIPGKGTLILQNEIMKNYEIVYQYYALLLCKIK